MRSAMANLVSCIALISLSGQAASAEPPVIIPSSAQATTIPANAGRPIEVPGSWTSYSGQRRNLPASSSTSARSGFSANRSAAASNAAIQVISSTRADGSIITVERVATNAKGNQATSTNTWQSNGEGQISVSGQSTTIGGQSISRNGQWTAQPNSVTGGQVIEMPGQRSIATELAATRNADGSINIDRTITASNAASGEINTIEKSAAISSGSPEAASKQAASAPTEKPKSPASESATSAPEKSAEPPAAKQASSGVGSFSRREAGAPVAKPTSKESASKDSSSSKPAPAAAPKKKPVFIVPPSK